MYLSAEDLMLPQTFAAEEERTMVTMTSNETNWQTVQVIMMSFL